MSIREGYQRRPILFLIHDALDRKTHLTLPNKIKEKSYFIPAKKCKLVKNANKLVVVQNHRFIQHQIFNRLGLVFQVHERPKFLDDT